MRVKSSAVWMDEKMGKLMGRHLVEQMEDRLAYCSVGMRVD